MSDNFEPEMIDEYFSSFVDSQKSAASTKNYDVYEKRLTDPDYWPDFELTPYSMFFYYVRINRNGQLVVDHYFYFNGEDENKPMEWKQIPYDKAELTRLVTTLAINARPSVKPADKKPKRLRKGDFKKTKWDRVSYIAIYFDEANWKLRKKREPGKPPSDKSAVTFVVRDGTKRGTPNHTFFDAMDLEIKMPIRRRRPKPGAKTEDERSAIVFVNHMKGDQAGNPLGNRRQPFEFKMLLDVQPEAKAGGPPTVIIIDPGGENGGPSVPPPPGPQ